MAGFATAARKVALRRKMKIDMREWKAGKLHSGSAKGPIVKNQKQAIAIAYSQAKSGR